MALTTFRSQFQSASKWVISQAKKLLPIVCGVPENALASVSGRYLITIQAQGGGGFGFGAKKPEFTIHAYLQDKIEILSNSTWYGLTQAWGGGTDAALGTADNFSQIMGYSVRGPATTRRKWNGSSPITVHLKLKFEAVYDVYKEVLLPCSGLQGLTLASTGPGFTVIPPGPNPYNIEAITKQTRGEFIEVNIGDFLAFTSVIVKEVKVTYENRMSAKGPIGADVDFTFETYEMLTREGLNDVYTSKISVIEQPATGVNTEQGVI